MIDFFVAWSVNVITALFFKRLNTPVKRLGFLILVVGFITLLIGLFKISANTFYYYGTLGLWWDSITLDRYAYTKYFSACAGTYLTLIGLLLSYLYDYTIGPLLNWIKNGSKA